MAQFAPHYATFTTINRIRAFSNFLFWAIFVLSLLDLVLPHDKPELLSTKIFEIGQIVNIIFLISFFFSEGIVDLILVPISDNKRRDDFLDNSIGSNLSLRQSVAYYDNDEVTQGLYKVAVNLFENCFFTHSLTKKLTVQKIIVPAIALITIVVFAFFGFKQQPTFALSLLQLLFSTTLLGAVVKHLILLNRLNQIEQDWVTLFNNPDFKNNPSSKASLVYKYWLNYETLHSRIPADIPSKIYDKCNNDLTTQWTAIKSKYNIS